MTTGKTIALTRQTFVGKVMSLLFNMLFKFVIAFLPRSKRLLISWLQSPSAVILEPKKIKSITVSIVSPSICHEVMGPEVMILVFECWVLSQIFHFLLLQNWRNYTPIKINFRKRKKEIGPGICSGNEAVRKTLFHLSSFFASLCISFLFFLKDCFSFSIDFAFSWL